MRPTRRQAAAEVDIVIPDSDPTTGIRFAQADESVQAKIAQTNGEKAAARLHFSSGFTITAVQREDIVGFASVEWRLLPAPLQFEQEAFLDILEVRPACRRRGIGSKLVEMCLAQALQHGAYQLRAWSSADKVEAIPLWRKLGFSLCPAITHHRGSRVTGFYVARVLNRNKAD